MINTYNNNKNNDINTALLIGRVDSTLSIHHTKNDINFLTFNLAITRPSGYNDIIPIIFHERIPIDYTGFTSTGSYIKVMGSVRSYNELDKNTNKRHVRIFVYATNIILLSKEEFDNAGGFTNIINMHCHVCKKPNYRHTLNKRITDLMLVCNRSNNKANTADYIPAIAWGLIADLSANICTKDRLIIEARFQSRQYSKIINESESYTGTSYELSINTLDIIPYSENI